jgi:phosphate transport system substrate-binding protein
VEIQAHDSTTAFQDLAAGTCDIGNASRKIKDKEAGQLSSLGDMTSISNEHVIGLDGIAILVNKSNALKQISTKDLQSIFSGRIIDWQVINGQKGGIAVYARDNNSGTFDTFKSLILGETSPLPAGAKRYESNSDLSDDVSRDPSGVGFTGLPYVREARTLAVSEEGAQAIYSNFFTVATEDYPISRRLYMYTASYTASVPKNPHVAPFINFVLSDKGQKVAHETGFVDMNIRTFFMDPADHENQASIQKVQGYLNAVKDAQRLSLNFRFKKNETVLDNRSMHDLDRIISFLADKLDKRIILAGFADNSGDSGYNSKLAMARAQLVASELRARGIAVGDIFSCGQEMPVASNTTEQGKEKNRRVEVWLK